MCAATSTNKWTRARTLLEGFQGQKARTDLDSVSKRTGKRNISVHQKSWNKVEAEATLCIGKCQSLTPCIGAPRNHRNIQRMSCKEPGKSLELQNF